MTLTLRLLPQRLAVCRLAATAPWPAWARSAPGVLSLTRRGEELSIVVDETCVPSEVRHVGDWRVLAVDGPIPFEVTGVLAALAGCLADAEVPLFSLSTFDTDLILVAGADLERAVGALTRAGHVVAPHAAERDTGPAE